MKQKFQNQINLSLNQFAYISSKSPMIMHLNPAGLLRLGNDNESRFMAFNSLINSVADKGGNLAIPVFSYSFLGGLNLFDMNKTPSKLEKLSEYLRKKNIFNRTCDPNFSYLLFGNNFDFRHKKVHDYNTFGEGGLIDDIFKSKGYLCALGGVLEHLTELHYIENRLKLSYRSNKIFSGSIIDYKGIKHNQNTTYYCRELESNYVSSFVKFKKDIRESGLLKKYFISEYAIRLEVVKFKDCYDFLKEKISIDPAYCLGKK